MSGTRRARLGRVLGMSLPFLAAASMAPADSLQVGVCVHVGQGRYGVDDTVARLRAGALTSFRDEATWSRIETSANSLSYPASLKNLDDLVDASVRNGVQPLIILDYGNQFHGNGGFPTAEADIAAFALYARTVVSHFKGRVAQFEIWNEWDIGTGLPAALRSRGTPEAYAALLRATYRAVKEANPSAQVIGGALAHVNLDWVDGFGRAGGFDSLDAFSVHPYNFSDQPKHHGLSVDRPIPGSPEAAMAGLDGLKAAIDRYSRGRTIKIFVTEIGWPTHSGPGGSSEQVSAAYLERFFLLARARPWIGGVWWYDLNDDGDDPTARENRFGLFRRNGSPKPSSTALAALHDLLTGPAAASLTMGSGGQISLRGKTADGRDFVAAWLQSDDFDQALPWPEAATLRAAGYRDAATAGAPADQLSATPSILIKN